MTDDTRVTCQRCQHYRGGRCMNAKRAGIGVWASIEIARALAELPQHCPAYAQGQKKMERECTT